jgi:hypothetical protein
LEKIFLICTLLLLFFRLNAQKDLTQKNNETIDIVGISKQEFDSKKEVSKILIKYDSIRFPKINGLINLSLLNGTSLKLKDNVGTPYDENRISYKYLGFLNIANKYLVSVKVYEASYYLLIDSSTGKKQKINGIPVISPNYEYFITTFYNQYDEYNDMPPPTQDIEIYKIINKSSLKKIISKHYKWSIKSLFWKNNNEIYIKRSKDKNSSSIDYVKLKIK